MPRLQAPCDLCFWDAVTTNGIIGYTHSTGGNEAKNRKQTHAHAYLCTHTYVHTHIRTSMCTHTHTYVHSAHTHLCTHTPMCTHTHTYVHSAHTHLCAHTHTPMCTVHTHTYAHTHLCAHTHTHLCAQCTHTPVCIQVYTGELCIRHMTAHSFRHTQVARGSGSSTALGMIWEYPVQCTPPVISLSLLNLLSPIPPL